MGLDHIKELLFGLLSTGDVSDLEVLVVSAVGLTGPILRPGWMVLLVGASPIDLVRPFFALAC